MRGYPKNIAKKLGYWPRNLDKTLPEPVTGRPFHMGTLIEAIKKQATVYDWADLPTQLVSVRKTIDMVYMVRYAKWSPLNNARHEYKDFDCKDKAWCVVAEVMQFFCTDLAMGVLKGFFPWSSEGSHAVALFVNPSGKIWTLDGTDMQVRILDKGCKISAVIAL